MSTAFIIMSIGNSDLDKMCEKVIIPSLVNVDLRRKTAFVLISTMRVDY